MYKIVEKKELSPEIMLYRIDAPLIAKKAKPGQFIILRVEEGGERIPLTIADSDAETGLVTIIFQIVGYTTRRLSMLQQGECLLDFVGPLGKASELDGIKKACIIGGGCGSAIAYPQAKALHQMGAKVDVINGFRNKGLVILDEEFQSVSDHYYICTDDGSCGSPGFVTQKLKSLLEEGAEYDTVIALGPLPMMRAVCDITRDPYIKTVISMNSIMLDGTGMCGACRLTVGGETKFACVDGPEFDGHLVDFAEAMERGKMYHKEEMESLEKHQCRLLGGAK
ncbi:MAG: sulfide/dihydroorotate dehydrogenase-like FAD/NAD-binding protein [Firmicutes bacterium]|nr:sulfide/dihydroorotate dehydrogenase-like FAD/NAD-binding protein [Bacillota bacterium]